MISVLCLHTATCAEGDIQLGVGNLTKFYATINEQEPYYFIKDELARGRVEVCIGGRYGAVCDDHWDNKDSSVACSQIGFSRYGIHRVHIYNLTSDSTACKMQSTVIISYLEKYEYYS